MRITAKHIRNYEYLFALYIGIGPVYWVPWIPLRVIEAVKFGLFLAVFMWPLLHKIEATRLHFPGGKKVFLWMAAFFGSAVPSMFLGDPASAVYKFQNTVQIFLLIYACGFLKKRRSLEIVARLSVKVFALFCLLSLILMFVAPNYVSPLNEELVLAQAGLGGSRTGWSPAIALYLPWLYSGVFVSQFGIMLGCFGMVANQVLVSGRTGMLSALVAFLIHGIVRKNFRTLLITAGVLLLAFVYVINNMEALRLSSGGFGSREALDDLSTGRIEVYLTSFKIIAENFVTGVGVGDVKYHGTNWAIHNIVLRSAAESGIVHGATIIGLFFVALKRGWWGIVQKDAVVISAFLTVVSGIVSSLFEPVGMFGTFYSAGFWWVSFAICVGYKRPRVTRPGSRYE